MHDDARQRLSSHLSGDGAADAVKTQPNVDARPTPESHQHDELQSSLQMPGARKQVTAGTVPGSCIPARCGWPPASGPPRRRPRPASKTGRPASAARPPAPQHLAPACRMSRGMRLTGRGGVAGSPDEHAVPAWRAHLCCCLWSACESSMYHASSLLSAASWGCAQCDQMSLHWALQLLHVEDLCVIGRPQGRNRCISECIRLPTQIPCRQEKKRSRLRKSELVGADTHGVGGRDGD